MKIDDRIVLITVVGLISAAIGKTSAIIVKHFYPPTITMTEVIAPIFFTNQNANTAVGFIFSTFLSLTVGGIYSFMYILLLDLTGWRYFWLKGFVVTSTGFLLSIGLLVKVLNLVPQEKNTVWIPIILYLAHMILMICQTVLVKMWGKPKNDRYIW